MAFDLGFNFRGTSGFVTDAAYGVPGLAEMYPHTYTAANGYSINAGVSGTTGSENNAASNDPRIAGDNYVNPSTTTNFLVDLSSGSAPGAGTYSVDLAMGVSNFGTAMACVVKDNTTIILDLTNGGSGYVTTNGHYIDASGANLAATTSWTGTPVNLTFATTTCYLVLNPASLASYTMIGTFRLTLASSQSVVPALMAEYRQRGA
ncbi:MAG TPA: hypothetical protein VN524_19390 [Hyphomicrobiaceae bacterium]|nr:hypothetical protein [Hyphomicrobiaceae bacterium]